MSERDEQMAVFDWASRMTYKYPELEMMYHVANERRCSPQQGARLKREGVKKGVPDIWLPVPRCGYHGIVVELKVKGGRVSPEQKAWIDFLNRQGYMALVAWGFEMAVGAIECYLRGKIEPQEGET